MGVPILDIIAAALPGESQVDKHDVARRILTALRDHDRDPEVLVSRLEAAQTEITVLTARADGLASAHIEHAQRAAFVADENAKLATLAERRAGAVRILANALAGGPLDVDAARALVEGDPDAAA